MSATFTQKLVGRFNSIALPSLLRCLDYRISYYDPTADPARRDYSQHGIATFWHEYILEVMPCWRHCPVTALCSKHRDGELVNQTALAMGMNVVRGSSSRGGASAIRQLKKNIKFSSIVITPDGPRGPRREMAMGPIFIASLLGVPLVPIGVGVSNPIRLNTWDSFSSPRPWYRVRLISGPRVFVPRKLGREGMEDFRRDYQKLQNDLCDEAQRWADDKKATMKGEQRLTKHRRCNKVWFDEPEKPSKSSLNVHRAA